jgi:hypothetical protein
MATGQDRLRVFENVMARVGLNGNFLEEYFKALSGINGMQSYNELNPTAPTIPPVTQNASDMGQIPQGGGTLPTLGEGGLNTPPNV